MGQGLSKKVKDFVEGNLEAKLLPYGQSRGLQSQGHKESEEKKPEKRTTEKKEDQRAQKSRKVSKHYVFVQCFVALEGRTIGVLKWRLRSHLAR